MSKIIVSRVPVRPPFRVRSKDTWWHWEIRDRRGMQAAGWVCGRRSVAFRAARAAQARLNLLASGENIYNFSLNSEPA